MEDTLCTKFQMQTASFSGINKEPFCDPNAEECKNAGQKHKDLLTCYNNRCMKNFTSFKKRILKLFKSFSDDPLGYISEEDVFHGLLKYFGSNGKGVDKLRQSVEDFWKALDPEDSTEYYKDVVDRMKHSSDKRMVVIKEALYDHIIENESPTAKLKPKKKKSKKKRKKKKSQSEMLHDEL